MLYDIIKKHKLTDVDTIDVLSRDYHIDFKELILANDNLRDLTEIEYINIPIKGYLINQKDLSFLQKTYDLNEFDYTIVCAVILSESNGRLQNIFKKSEKGYGYGHFQKSTIEHMKNKYPKAFGNFSLDQILECIINPRSPYFIYINLLVVVLYIDYAINQYSLFERMLPFRKLTHRSKIFFITAYHNHPKTAMDSINEHRMKVFRTPKKLFGLKRRFHLEEKIIEEERHLKKIYLECLPGVNYVQNTIDLLKS